MISNAAGLVTTAYVTNTVYNPLTNYEGVKPTMVYELWETEVSANSNYAWDNDINTSNSIRYGQQFTTNYFGRDAANNTIGRNVSYHYSTSADNRIPTDRDPRRHHHPCADIGAASYDSLLLRQMVSKYLGEAIRIIGMRQKHAASNNRHVVLSNGSA